MATNPEHAPQIPHIRLPDIKGAARWVQTNWKPVGLSLAATALGLTGYFMATHNGEQNPPIRPTTDASDTFKPPESEFVVVPAVPTEVTPAAGASASPEPPTPEPTKVPSTPTTEPTEAPIVEVKNEFDCGILSPEDCAKPEYIQWDTPFGKLAEAIAMKFEAGKKFKLPEAMQVAAVEETYQSKPYGYRIVAARKDGSQIIIDGDVIPIGVGKVGKELPAGTIIAESAESGLPVLVGEYTQFIHFTSERDLKEQFPEQTKKPPKLVINKAAPPSQSNTQGGGVILFDVQPPQSR